MNNTWRHWAACISIAFTLSACGGGGSGSSGYTVSGTVSGLHGSGLTLQVAAGNTVAVSASGNFKFSGSVANGTAYTITVVQQPTSPTQTCTVTPASGTISGADVTSITVTCTTSTYTIGGTVTGLNGTGLTLQDNGADSLSVSGGSFVFATPVASGSAYAVTVQTQPAAAASALPQTCVVQSGSGTVGGANVSNVSVVCSANAARFVYVANGSSNTISGFAINSATGALTALTGSPYATGTQPVSVTVTPNGKLAYTSNAGSNDISAYHVDAGTGVLSPVSGSPFVTGGTLAAGAGYPNSPLLIDPSGKLAFVTMPNAVVTENVPLTFVQAANFAAFTIDAASGALNPVSGSPFTTQGPAQQSLYPMLPTLDAGGHHIYIVNQLGATGSESISIAVFNLDATAGTVGAVSGSPFPFPLRSGSIQAFTLTPSGKFAYLTSNGGLNLCVNADAASPAFMTGCGQPALAAPLLVSSKVTGEDLYTFSPSQSTGTSGGTVNYYTIDSTAGTLTAISGSPAAAGNKFATAMTLDPTGRFLFVAGAPPNTNGYANVVDAYRVDPQTGALSAVTGSPFALGANPAATAVDPSGKFIYVSSTSSNSIYAFSIDLASGALTAVPGSPFATGNAPGQPVFVY